jgi:hypothetical protein
MSGQAHMHARPSLGSGNASAVLQKLAMGGKPARVLVIDVESGYLALERVHAAHRGPGQPQGAGHVRNEAGLR